MSDRSIYFVSLGCPKNRVDSEVMLGVAQRSGLTHSLRPESADVIVVNTCGFIESAKDESIQTILELAEHKRTGNCEQLIVAGCLSQRHPEELAEGMPEVDYFLGSSDMTKLGKILTQGGDRIQVGNPADWVMGAADPRVVSTIGASAYVKIAEGCNRRCSFCVIPQLRGGQRSRSVEDVVSEVTRLAQSGVKEINLVSQDTVSYGKDLRTRSEAGKWEGPDLARLVHAVAEVPGIQWVRLFYLYPEQLSNDIVELIASHPSVVPYIDMPLQHAADSMLRRMRRGHGGQRLREFVEHVRQCLPGVVFRTAFIVGHPEESEAEFEELCEFVRWARFDHVGVFRYSDESTCHSHTLGGKVPDGVAAERAETLMALQQTISRENNEARVGSKVEVLVEGPSEESEWVMQGRWHGQAPDIDGNVYVSGGPVYAGRIYSGTVASATDFELEVDVGELEDCPPTTAGNSPVLQHRDSDGRVTLRTVS